MKSGIKVRRFDENPLIVPDENKKWMSYAAFNCGVIYDEESREFKMLIRGSSGPDRMYSNVGLATSEDGKKWRVSEEPVLKCGFNEWCTWGIEDPRIVKWIDGYYYVFATVWSEKGIKIGIFKTANFEKFQWIGIPIDRDVNIDNKNSAIFPELINGWVYLLHRRPPDIWISRTKDITLKEGWQDHRILVSHKRLYKHPIYGTEPNKIGIAGPPVKLNNYWLQIIHVAHDDPKYGRAYSLSFVMLDENLNVCYIHPFPILWPEEEWEVEGWRGFEPVKNVVFSCATVPLQEKIYIYYGAADTVICGGYLKRKDFENLKF